MFSDQEFPSSRRFLVAEEVLEALATSTELLDALTGSFNHLLTATEKPDIRLLAWSIDDVHRIFPDPPVTHIRLGFRGEIENISDKRFRFVFHSHSQVLIAVDCLEGIVIVVTRTRSGLMGIDCAAPLKIPLCWLLPRSGIVMAHAGAVAKDGQSILLVGRSGAGKSTLAYQCIQAGWKFMGDDLVALSSNQKPKSFSLYSTVKLWDDFSDPVLRELRMPQWQERNGKGVYRLDRLNAEVFSLEAELRAVVVIDRSFNLGAMEPFSRAKTVAIIGASSNLTLPTAGAELFAGLSKVLTSVPCWRFSPHNDFRTSYQSLESLIG